MADSSYVWLSVVVKRGTTTVVSRRVVKEAWESNFGEVLSNLLATLDAAPAETTIKKVSICNEIYLDPTHQVDVAAPLSVCKMFNCQYVCFYLEDEAATTSSTSMS